MKSEAIRVRLESEEFAKLDEYCRINKMSRSMAIRKAISLLLISMEPLPDDLEQEWQDLASLMEKGQLGWEWKNGNEPDQDAA